MNCSGRCTSRCCSSMLVDAAVGAFQGRSSWWWCHAAAADDDDENAEKSVEDARSAFSFGDRSASWLSCLDLLINSRLDLLVGPGFDLLKYPCLDLLNTSFLLLNEDLMWMTTTALWWSIWLLAEGRKSLRSWRAWWWPRRDGYVADEMIRVTIRQLRCSCSSLRGSFRRSKCSCSRSSSPCFHGLVYTSLQ